MNVSGTLRRNVLGAIALEKNDRNFPRRRRPSSIKLTQYTQNQQRLNKTGDYANYYPYAATWKETAFFFSSLTDSYRNGFIVRSVETSFPK